MASAGLLNGVPCFGFCCGVSGTGVNGFIFFSSEEGIEMVLSSEEESTTVPLTVVWCEEGGLMWTGGV